MKSQDLKQISEIFVKTAAYIEELEAKIQSSETRLVEFSKQASVQNEKIELTTDALAKFASSGFSQEEVESLRLLDKATFEKVAELTSKPWGMGGGTGPSLEGGLDPLADFLVNFPSRRR